MKAVCISGPDGSGKTTQARLLVASQGSKAEYRWFRFHHFLVLPILAYLRLARKTREMRLPNGRKIGFHDLAGARFTASLYAGALVVDTFVACILYIYVPNLFGKTVVMDRCTVDTTVDISISTGRPDFYRSPLGRILLNLIPRESAAFMLMAPENDLIARRPESACDSSFEQRIELYLAIAENMNAVVVWEHARTVEEIHAQIAGVIDDLERGRDGKTP